MTSYQSSTCGGFHLYALEDQPRRQPASDAAQRKFGRAALIHELPNAHICPCEDFHLACGGVDQHELAQ